MKQRMNFQMKYLIHSFLLLVFLGISFSVQGKELPPRSTKLVNDFTGTLNPAEIANLEEKLVAYDDSTSTQIAVVMENTLEGEDIFDYSFRLAQDWGIGRKGKNNGLLIYIALEDRKIFMQIGSGLEGKVTDAQTKRIIETIIKPAFRNKAYFAGLDQATSKIIQITQGEFSKDPVGEGIPLIFIILIILMIIIVLSSISRGGGRGYYKGGKYDDWTSSGPVAGPWWIGGGGGSSSGGGWSGGGGGFGGFGGGGFSGGGAGGDW
jgi:uncharacterized protein